MAEGPVDYSDLFGGLSAFQTKYQDLLQQKANKKGSPTSDEDTTGKVTAQWGNRIVDNQILAIVKAIEDGLLGGGGGSGDPQWNIATSLTGPTSYTMGDYELVAYDGTGGTVTISAPASPVEGQQFAVVNTANTALGIELTLDGNGNSIQNPITDIPGPTAVAVSSAYGSIHYVWNSDKNFWQILNKTNYIVAAPGILPPIQTSDLLAPGFTNVVGQYLFNGDLTEATDPLKDLSVVSGPTGVVYPTYRGKQFASVQKNMRIESATALPAYQIAGDCTIYMTVDMHQMPTSDTVIALYGTPGTNAAGTEYQWSFYFDGSAGQNIQCIHEWSGGNKEIIEGHIPFSEPMRLCYRRVAGTTTNELYCNGILVASHVGPNPNGGAAASQRLHIGGNSGISMLVAELVICDAAHSPATILADAVHVGLI